MNHFWSWWQHLPENIDPVIVSVGTFKLQYYGLMYLVAFGTTYMLMLYRVNREPRFTLSKESIQGLMMAMIIGLVLGARLGYVVFYNLSYFSKHPLEIFLPFSFSNGFQFTGISGMSYHGGLIGVIVASFIFIKQHRLTFLDMADLVAPAVPLGYTFGRLGNFINGELYGRITTHRVGMYFPSAPSPGLRHPSQLYEALFEGILLFILLWSIRKHHHPKGAMLAFYLIGYGTVRFFIEFFREPDSHLGFVWGAFSMGQLLCLVMVLTGIAGYKYCSILASRAN